MTSKERSCKGFVKREDYAWEGFMTYKRRKSASSDVDLVQGICTGSVFATRAQKIHPFRYLLKLGKVTGQLSGGRKHSLSADTTVQSKYSGSDCSIKPHETEAADLYNVCTCKQCGCEANGQRNLICDGCEAMYHFSGIKPSINEIPTRSCYCSACNSNGKDSHDRYLLTVRKAVYAKTVWFGIGLTFSETLEDVDVHGSGAIVIPDCGESSVSTMEPEEPPNLSRIA